MACLGDAKGKSYCLRYHPSLYLWWTGRNGGCDCFGWTALTTAISRVAPSRERRPFHRWSEPYAQPHRVTRTLSPVTSTDPVLAHEEVADEAVLCSVLHDKREEGAIVVRKAEEDPLDAVHGPRVLRSGKPWLLEVFPCWMTSRSIDLIFLTLPVLHHLMPCAVMVIVPGKPSKRCLPCGRRRGGGGR